AHHGIAIGTLVAAARRPVAPPRDRLRETSIGLGAERRDDRRVALGVGQAEVATLAHGETYGADQAIADRAQFDVRVHDHDLVVPGIDPAEPAAPSWTHPAPGIVGPHIEADLEIDQTFRAFDHPQHFPHWTQRSNAV